MLIPLGFWAASAGGGAAGSFDLLETQVLASSAASVTFSSLSTYAADYQHLQIRAVVQTTRAASLDSLRITFNGDTGANYSFHWLQADGSSVTSSAGANQSNIFGGYLPGTANSYSWAPSVTDILDPFETTKYTTTRTLDSFVDPNWKLLNFTSGNWRNTAALSSITIDQEVGPSFSIGSRFSIYGLKVSA